MIAECNVVCGSWGQGMLAGERLMDMLPWVGFALLFVGAIWIISAVQK